MITAQIEQASMDKLTRTLDRIVKATGKTVSQIVWEASGFALRTAIKATRPGTASSIPQMAKKFRFRPITKIPEAEGYFYQYETEDGEKHIFATDKLIGGKGKRAPKRITRGIQWWNKASHGWAWWPFIDRPAADSKILKIPHAGAAKAGWLHGLQKLGHHGAGDQGDNRRRLADVRRTEMEISVTNLVDYVQTISPDAVTKALRSAEGRMRHTYFPKIENKIKREAAA